MGKKKDVRVYAIQSTVNALDFQLINNYNIKIKSGKKSTLKYRFNESSSLAISEEDGVLKVKEEVLEKGVSANTALILTLPQGSVFAVKGCFDGEVSLILPEKFGYKNVELTVTGKTDVALDGSAESLLLNVIGSAYLRSKELKCPSIKINSSGSATAVLAGEGNSLAANVSGICKIYAKDFYLFTVGANVSGLAKFNIKVKELIKLNSSGHATVDYYGEPNIDKTVTGFANLNKVGKIEKTKEEKQAEKEQKLQKKNAKKEAAQQKKKEKEAKKAEQAAQKASANAEKSDKKISS